MTWVAAPAASLGPKAAERSPVASRGRRGNSAPLRATVLVIVIGLLITLSASWTAWTLNRHNEHSLLEIQTRQATALLGASILSLRDPLETALEIVDATGGDVQQFDDHVSTLVGPGRSFVSVVLLRPAGTTWRPVSVVGVKPLLAPGSSRAASFVGQAFKSPTFAVTAVPTTNPRRIGYAVANPKSPTIAIYAERAIPADRVVPVEKGSAFSDLNFATYLGPTTRSSALATTDLPDAQLPIQGDVVRTSIPFGNSSLTLLTAPRGALGGALGGVLPWIFLVSGSLLTLGAAVVTYQLVRRRRLAERDAQTIATLYRQLDGLYDEQRSIAETLQQALLPRRNPSIPNLEVASRYLAGTDGLEIGGDWFSLIEIGDHHFAFAVGDVSGKGVDAAAIMARLRFTIRAYLTEGHAPDVVLGMCSRQLNVNRDGHLSTVLIGLGDTHSGEISLSNAGHLNPLRIADTSAEFVSTEVGLPLGVAPSTYALTTLRLTSGSTFVAFTDGLVERRGESIDVGLERLVRAAACDVSTVDDLVSRLLDTVGRDGSDDDVAVLAFRWTSSADAPAGPTARLDPVS